MSNHLITLVLVLLTVGVILQWIVPNFQSRWTALAISITASIIGVILVLSMRTDTSELQAIESLPWVGAYSINYEVAIDGLNAVLVLLISILFPVLIASEWHQKLGRRGMHALFLALQASLFGAVCAQDLFLQFFFWAMSALPFYFLVGIWGGSGREKAAVGSIVSASLGNAFVFCALLLVYYTADPHTFLLRELAKAHLSDHLSDKSLEFLGISVSALAFGLMGIGLALRASVWPLHGWFIEVAQEAPFSVFVALAAGVIPTALYIFIRISHLLFPTILMDSSKILVAVGLLNLLVGGLCAISQRGLRKLLAFVCISEMGMIIMGIGSINPTGLVGSVYQQLMLGIGLAGFGLFASVISERTGHSEFLNAQGDSLFGGIATRAPMIAVVAGVVIGSVIGIPGLGGFVGHSLVIIGGYAMSPLAVFLSLAALLLAPYYLFTMYKNIFLGKFQDVGGRFEDLTLRERIYMAPLVCSLVCFGIYPKPLIDLIRPTVLSLLSTIR